MTPQIQQQRNVVARSNAAGGNGDGGDGGRNRTPACPKTYTGTQAVLHAMFAEDIGGGDVLDSGDAYGRLADSYRQVDDRLAEPELIVERADGGAGGEATVHRSTFHALDAVLEYSPEMDARFARFCRGAPQGKTWNELAAEFAESQDGSFCEDVNVHNTYDGPCLLDAPFRWTEFYASTSVDDTETASSGNSSEFAHGRRTCCVALVQLHLGCDMRSGYGRPRAFVVRHHAAGVWQTTRMFDAACGCSRIQCSDDGMVYNEEAASECECHHDDDGDEEEAEGGGNACICGTVPEEWAPSGRPDGSLACSRCGRGVDVS